MPAAAGFRARREVGVAMWEPNRRKAEIKQPVAYREVPDGRRQEGPGRVAVRGEDQPAARIGRIGHQPTAELVERVGEALQVGLLRVRREIDVLGAVPSAVGLDRGGADDDKPDLEQDLQ